MQLETLPDPNYMERQDELTWRMRGILVDWLVEVHTKFRLLPETIFLGYPYRRPFPIPQGSLFSKIPISGSDGFIHCSEI